MSLVVSTQYLTVSIFSAIAAFTVSIPPGFETLGMQIKPTQICCCDNNDYDNNDLWLHSPVDCRGTMLWWLSWAPPSVWERSPPPPRPLCFPLLVEVCLPAHGSSYLEISLKRICVPCFFFFSKWVLGFFSLGKIFTDKVFLLTWWKFWVLHSKARRPAIWK